MCYLALCYGKEFRILQTEGDFFQDQGLINQGLRVRPFPAKTGINEVDKRLHRATWSSGNLETHDVHEFNSHQ